MANKKGSDDGKKRRRRRRRARDPNAPKRALTAYFYFCNEERPKVKKAMPTAPVTQIASELGKRWNELNDKQKSKYAALAAKDKARYAEEADVWKKNRAGGKAGKSAEVESSDSD